MSRAQISEINTAVLDVLGLAEMGDRISAITVTLHRTTWPTARLEVILDQATGRTERQFVRLVPEGPETARQATWIDKACTEAMEKVQAGINRSCAEAEEELGLKSIPLSVSIPQFHSTRTRNGVRYSCSNNAAHCAFERFEVAMVELESATRRLLQMGWGEAFIRLKGLK